MQRTCDLPGVWSVNQIVGQRKLRRVEDIENLAPQFQLASLFQFEVFEDGEVGVVKGWSTKAAAARVPEPGRVTRSRWRRRLTGGNRGQSEGCWVVPAVHVLAGGRAAGWRGAPDSVVAIIETYGSIGEIISIAN